MPLEQTITIVNNSGKIISTGKHLVSIFKEAKASYQDKKAQIKSERTLQRAQTFDHTRSTNRRELGHHDHDYYGIERDYDDDYDHRHRSHHDSHDRHRDYDRDHDHDHDHDHHRDRDRDRPDGHRRRSYDAYSVASSRRSHRSKTAQSKRHRDSDGRPSHPALTENNLKTLSEVSSTAPSKAPPGAYRSPYAETLDKGRSRMDLTQADARSVALTDRRRSTVMPRRRSESELGKSRDTGKEIDMHLAYGNIPPDLESRIDLDPARQEEYKEQKARQLVRKVEGLLDEAHCLQHSATATISHLQKNPDAAAAVALTLAELSTIITKMSPTFLGFLKGGSPAVFALLASPQFLIGTGIAVGVTIVMFGGWKIVKKVKEAQAAREALAFDGIPANRPAPMRTQSEFTGGSMDEALVVEDELSTIETWRRGIKSTDVAESVDMELITPEAERANRETRVRDGRPRDDFDTRSRRSTRTSKTAKTSKTQKTSRTAKKEKSKREEREIPERKSSKQASATTVVSEPVSRKSSSKNKDKSKSGGVKMIEDGRNSRGDDDLNLVLRPRVQRQGSNMLKVLFKSKKEKEEQKEMAKRQELVLA